MTRKRQQPLDPSVAWLVMEPEKKKIARGAEIATEKVTLNLPAYLIAAIRQEAFALTRHKRRGFSGFMTVLLQYAWDAYQAGELEIELQPIVVGVKITAAKK